MHEMLKENSMVTFGSWCLQDVMKESASIAHTYARIKLANYQVISAQFLLFAAFGKLFEGVLP